MDGVIVKAGAIVAVVQGWGAGAQPGEGETFVPCDVTGRRAGQAFPAAADVKAEARRRILAIAPEWRQINLLRESPEHADLARIDAIRAASDSIEALEPIPLDYAADSRWPA